MSQPATMVEGEKNNIATQEKKSIDYCETSSDVCCFRCSGKDGRDVLAFRDGLYACWRCVTCGRKLFDG